MLELVDVSEKALDLVTGFVDVVIELIVHLVPSLDLRLEVLHCSVDIAQ